MQSVTSNFMLLLGLSNELEKCIVQDEVNDFNDC